jgi:predicted metal-dependent phosphoesterase TrpH
MKAADLHIHTTYSDGTHTPEEVVKVALENELSAIAITDHDITDGIEPALKYGAKVGMEVIPGIELSCEYNSTEIHMLGYYINWENMWFQEKLRIFQKARERRAYYILNKLKDIGIELDEQMLFSQADVGSISRIHFARCLMEMGVVKSLVEAFQKYLIEGRPAFVKKLRVTPEEALNMIHRIGGISILAHPVYGGMNKKFIGKLKKLGLCGVEAYHPSQSPSKVKRLEKIADELNLIKTGGTDSHGGSEEENPIGSNKIDYVHISRLKEIKNKFERKNRMILT